MKNSSWTGRWGVVGCLAALGAAAVPEPTFYAPFDGSATAAVAAGQAEPLTAEHLTFGPGLKGQAVRLEASARSRLAYAFARNVSAQRGTVSFWFRPAWAPQDKRNHYLFAFDFPWGASRQGTGSVFLWDYAGRLRADRSDASDQYRMAPKRFGSNVWHHVAYTWAGNKTALYFDGHAARDTRPVVKDTLYATDFGAFFVGGCREGREADGWIDEFRIYAETLSDAAVNELRAEFAALDLRAAPVYCLEGENARVTVEVANRSAQSREVTWTAGRETGTISVPPRGSASVSVNAAGLPAGRLTVRAESPDAFAAEATLWILRRENPLVVPAGTELSLRLVERLALDHAPPAERFVTTGDQVFRQLNGHTYMETGGRRGSRFGVRFHLPNRSPLYCFEWDYPDDTCRVADIIVQPSDASSESRAQHGESDIHDYQLQVGYLTGDEYPNSNRMLTSRCLYWAKQQDVAVVFAALKDQAPAAVSEIRLYEVSGGLPDAGVRTPQPVGGWRRSLALYYEDPAIAYDFGTGSLMPGFEDLIDRTAAYMRYTGQDLFVYPGVWYNGLIGPGYDPRPKTPHAERFLEGWMTKFDAQGLGVMPSFNLFEVPALRGLRTEANVTNGSLYASCAMVLDSGRVSFKASHGRAPDVNILHPDVQAAVLADVDALIALGRDHPSFKGLDFRLSEHCCLWFGNIYAGYNDYTVEAFSKATGIQVPVDRSDPLRGKAYAAWLMANARDAWVDWRCLEIARFYKQIAARLAAARSDLRLVLTLLTPLNHRGESSYSDPHFVNRQNKQAGVDASLFGDAPNIVISQGCRPMRYRAGYDVRRPNYDETFFRDVFYTRACYESLDGARTPWLHNHDHYWETSFGDVQRQGKSVPPLEASWFKEHPWRVTTINPAGHYALKQYVVPLRYHDLQGITRGGFLVGTYGVEPYLIPFARAFRALPAKPFAEVSGCGELVKVRALQEKDQTWLYAVNTGDEPASVTVTGVSGAVDLVTGQPPSEGADAGLSLRLEPYQMLAFRADAGCFPAVSSP